VETLIARRYLVSKRKTRFINVIGYISIIGITIGVAALLVALSVFNGFNSVVTSVLVGFDPHLRLEKRGSMTTEEYESIANILRKHSGVQAFSPFISGKAMLTTRTFTKVVFVKGVEERSIGSVSGLGEKIILGSVKLQPDGEQPGIIVGLTLADRLASVVGNEIVIYGPSGIQTALIGMSAPQSSIFRVCGIYESNNKDYDANYAYIGIEAAQQLFNLDGKYNGIEMRLKDFHDAERIKGELAGQLPADITIATWYDLHQSLYTVMTVERWTAYVLLCLIVVVATFNMLGSLTMGVIEKQRDIAVLKSMGMTSNNIIRIFMVEGVLIGLIGTVGGIIIGLAVLFLQTTYQIFPLDTSIYIIPAIPVEIRWSDFVSIAIASLGLSFLAAYYPARRAASTVPAEALRWE
jgi:lipoprotein-releasing system permease protein